MSSNSTNRPSEWYKVTYFRCLLLQICAISLNLLERHQTEAVAQECSVKQVLSEILQNSQENTCVKVSFLIKLQAQACYFILKETLAQVFSCEFCEISKNTFCYRTPPVAASNQSKCPLWNTLTTNQHYSISTIKLKFMEVLITHIFIFIFKFGQKLTRI